MSGAPAGIPDADKKMADQIMLIGTGVCAVFALLALVSGGILNFIIDGALAAGLWFFGVMKLREGDLQMAKMVSLVVGAVLAVLGLLALSGGVALALLIGLVALGTAGALIYAAMLLSPGRKLF